MIIYCIYLNGDGFAYCDSLGRRVIPNSKSRIIEIGVQLCENENSTSPVCELGFACRNWMKNSCNKFHRYIYNPEMIPCPDENCDGFDCSYFHKFSNRCPNGHACLLRASGACKKRH